MPQRVNLPPPAEKNDENNGKVTPAHFSPIRGETGELWVLDEWGLLVRKSETEKPPEDTSTKEKESKEDGEGRPDVLKVIPGSAQDLSQLKVNSKVDSVGSDTDDEFRDAQSTPNPATPLPEPTSQAPTPQPSPVPEKEPQTAKVEDKEQESSSHNEKSKDSEKPETRSAEAKSEVHDSTPEEKRDADDAKKQISNLGPNKHNREASSGSGLGISEWSHQQLAPKDAKVTEEKEDEWQDMPSYAPYDIYDDDNRLIAREERGSDNEVDAYAGLGGAGRGYTRVQLDEDAQSATSMDENTQYLFKDVNGGTGAGEMEDEEQRDAVSQMQATKDLLTEGQRVAYVGMTRLILSDMLRGAEAIVTTKGSKKELMMAAEAMKMWSQKMMVRLYAHMDISTAEQIMIEQLADHGVMPADLTPALMANSRVKNPMAEEVSDKDSVKSPRPSTSSSYGYRSPNLEDEEAAKPPPAYQEHEGDDLPEVRTPSQLPTTANIDIDLRWTVLCDLFLTLIADSVYDARSRVLLEKVGQNMEVSWLEICRFEKRVTDALEMQQAAEKENWNEDEHKEARRKMALNKRYLMMGLATVGGGLVIGLSAGLLAPVIGAGLAAGFTTIGVAGTSGFLAGTGAAAIITSAAATSGGIIAIRAADRRTGAVKTFEYRPLHNNKRVNLIVTVSGWMTGKVDDVRLPYSTVDPIMGDIYSVLWEPEMLQSMGDTINILATEALTQGLQQVLGSTILISLMAALQLPVVLTKLAYLIDNPWSVSLDRATSAGLILADSLIDRNLGTRPITFVGYSLGSRVIFSCLKELARKGAYGLVQNVYLFGSPIVAKKDEYLRARAVVAGRFVNGYATNDWILGYLFRLTSGGISRVAGLAKVEDIPGLENVDVTEFVPGHMSYRTAMPRLLREVGWIVESDEFTEIEDPDPDNHQQRQRELINEIEEARKDFEKKEKKGKFGFFGRKKKNVAKKQWETYEETKGGANGETSKEGGSNEGVLFDIDAIRRELASEHMEVRELESTLPPMKLALASPSPLNPRSSLRASQSYDPNLLKANGNGVSPMPSPSPSPRHSTTLPTQWTAKEPSPSSHWPDDEDSPTYNRRADDEVQMTFDTSYETPPRSARTSGAFHYPASNSSSLHNIGKIEIPKAEPSPLQRPDLKANNTAPAPLPMIDLNHNAWADEDEDFGVEKEIEMTFA
ncbi:hypothetical protein B0O99DRAFT_690700 [Bisporella sp. PMI_857]|nr:hypothetical protein B0O99DRAFT_690700 [Bisporella sp. PMI_857]